MQVMLDLLTPQHWRRIKAELVQPSPPEVIPNVRIPKYDFGPLPGSLDAAVWSPEEFARRGFPIRDLPDGIPATLNGAGFDAAVSAAQRDNLMDPGWLPPLRTVRSWMVEGCEEYLSWPGTLPTNSPHLIGPDEMKMCLESLARFQYM